MPAPTEPTNVEKVMRAVQYRLARVNHANGYRTDGLVINGDQSPIGLLSDPTDDFKKLNAAVAIGPGHESIQPPRTGGVRRYRYQYPLMCIRMITVDQIAADRRLPDVIADFVDDLKTALDSDQAIKAAVAALGYTGPFSCINHHIPNVRSDEGIVFPYCLFVAVAQFDYDRPV